MQYDQIVCEIRCPVHGFIGLTDLERGILDSPAFQRLRRIKQLAWTDYIYPGATHTRFEHSLGVMHLATRLFDSIVDSSDALLRRIYKYNDNGLARARQIVRLAALLHDVGHPPFSHATEKLLPMKEAGHYSLFEGEDKEPQQYEHEDYSVAIIEGPLRELIEGHTSNKRNYKIEVSEISALIGGKKAGASLFWKDIISGQLDADRMDYLLRDSLHAGVSYGKYDLNRIVSSVCAIERPSEESKEPKIAVMRGGAYAVEALIVARYWMHKQVYFHKTRLACNKHLLDAMTEILKKESASGTYPFPNSPEQLQAFLGWDDFRVMGLLASGEGGEHGKRLMTRNHYRLVCEIDELSTSIADLENSKKRVDALVKILGDKVKDVQRPGGLWYKTKANDQLILVEDDGHEEIGTLSTYSALMKSINMGSQHFIYADKPDIPAAKAEYKTFLRDEAEKLRSDDMAIGEGIASDFKKSPSATKILEREARTTGSERNSRLTLSPPEDGKTSSRQVPPQKGAHNAG